MKMMLIKRLKSGWTLLKWIRVGLGGLILLSSAGSGHIAGMVAGGLFTLFALFTDGVCCAGGGCYTPVSRNISSSTENIDYEELGTK